MKFNHREISTVNTIARKAAANYGLDSDELKGVLNLWMCESYKYVQKYRDEAGGGAKLAASLFRHANKWARLEASAKVIVHKPQRDAEESLYDHQTVEVALVLMFLDHDVTADYNEDTWAAVADISGVYASIVKKEKELLYWRFGLHEAWDLIANKLDIEPDAARMRVQRLVEKLAKRASSDKANRDRPHLYESA